MHIFDHKKHHALDSKERYKMLNPHTILTNAGLKKGLIGADIGCGTGFFTIPAAKILNAEGKIYAFDIQKQMLTYLRMKIDSPNIVPILIENENKYKLPLKNKLLDFALLSFVLHEVENKTLLLNEIKRVLKDNAILITIEWLNKEEEIGPPKQHRISQNTLRNLLKNSNFVIKQFSILNTSHYISIAT